MTIIQHRWTVVDVASEWEDSELIGGVAPFAMEGETAKLEVRIKPPLSVGDQITTVEGLEALPGFTALLDGDGDVWKREARGFVMAEEDAGMHDAVTIHKHSPFTVVYLPEED